RCDDVMVDLHRLLRVDVDDVHEPSRVVRADRDHDEVERAAPLANLSELVVVRGITRKERALSLELEREPAPERLVPIAEPAGAESARWGTGVVADLREGPVCDAGAAIGAHRATRGARWRARGFGRSRRRRGGSCGCRWHHPLAGLGWSCVEATFTDGRAGTR